MTLYSECHRVFGVNRRRRRMSFVSPSPRSKPEDLAQHRYAGGIPSCSARCWRSLWTVVGAIQHCPFYGPAPSLWWSPCCCWGRWRNVSPGSATQFGSTFRASACSHVSAGCSVCPTASPVARCVLLARNFASWPFELFSLPLALDRDLRGGRHAAADLAGAI